MTVRLGWMPAQTFTQHAQSVDHITKIDCSLASQPSTVSLARYEIKWGSFKRGECERFEDVVMHRVSDSQHGSQIKCSYFYKPLIVE